MGLTAKVYEDKNVKRAMGSADDQARIHDAGYSVWVRQRSDGSFTTFVTLTEDGPMLAAECVYTTEDGKVLE